MKVKRIGVFSCAKVAGALYCILGLIVGALFALIGVAGFAASAAREGLMPGVFPALFGVGAIVLFPMLYGTAGFLGGLIVSALYNLLAGIVGGIEVELQ